MDNAKVLKFLTAELAFLEQGGYEQNENEYAGWRASLIFEDSPNCPALHLRAMGRPCDECPLMMFVPQERRNEPIPCRFLPIDDEGHTLEWLYSRVSKQEIIQTVRAWLKARIAELEGRARQQAA